MATISIIMPVYNSEQYVSDTIKSVLAQTYRDFELIIINDGSTDNTSNIINEIADSDDRVRVYNKPNGGVSSARNAGLAKALGQYICFIDSDDTMENDYLEMLCENINESTNAQMVVSSYSSVGDSVNTRSRNIIKTYYSGDSKYDFIFNKEYAGYVWGKIYLKSIIEENDISFCEHVHMLEDELFVVDYLKYCDNIVVVNERKYRYRKRADSICSTLSNEKWYSVINAIEILSNKLESFGEKQKRDFSYLCLYFLFEAKSRTQKHTKIRNEIESKINWLLDMNIRYTFKQNIKIFLYRHANTIVFRVRRIT